VEKIFAASYISDAIQKNPGSGIKLSDSRTGIIKSTGYSG
jgi:hypothetical protein